MTTQVTAAQDRRIEELANRELALACALQTTAINGEAAAIIIAAEQIKSFLETYPAGGEEAFAFALTMFPEKAAVARVIESAETFVAFLHVPPVAVVTNRRQHFSLVTDNAVSDAN